MTKKITPTQHYSPRATLAALGIKVRSLKFFDTIAEHVRIPQKTVRHTPLEKLTDAFIAMLSGAHGLSEINTRVRSDPAMQRAFGRTSCAEQSVVQETLDACTEENIRQMEQAVDIIFRAHSRAFRHNYEEGLQLLDADMTGCHVARRRRVRRKATSVRKAFVMDASKGAWWPHTMMRWSWIASSPDMCS